MPVEIRELVIRAVVQEGAAPAQEQQARPPGQRAALSAGDQAALVETAVKEVLRILKAAKER